MAAGPTKSTTIEDSYGKPRGFVQVDYLDKHGRVVRSETEEEFNIENLVVNVFRELLPLLLAPRSVTGRVDNSPSNTTWLDRRICLIGFGVGDNGTPIPTTKPEEPEDGRTKLVGETDYPNSKQGLQGAIRRVPLTPTGPSEMNTLAVPINSYYLLKEVDADGVSIVQVENGGAEITFVFTLEEDEYIGNIVEMGLFFGGGDAGDETPIEILASTDYDCARLNRQNARMAARKTRVVPLEKTRDGKVRIHWRIRT